MAMSGRVIDADGHPQDLSMPEVLAGAEMLGNDFQDHVGAEAEDAWSADAGELGGDAVRHGVFPGFCL